MDTVGVSKSTTVGASSTVIVGCGATDRDTESTIDVPPPVRGLLIRSQAVPMAKLDAASSLAQALIVSTPTQQPQYPQQWGR